ncbi:hypothetical protein D3C76_324320 [compost metagenome]
MKKSELQAEIVRLNAELATQREAFQASIQGGLEFQRRFQEMYLFAKSITGLNSHPQWLELQSLIQKYEVIQHPTYGEKVIPKHAHQWIDTNSNCVCCGKPDE